MTEEQTPLLASFTSVENGPFEAMAEASAGWDGQYTQLDRGGARGCYTQLRLRGVDVALDWVERRVRVQCTPPRGGVPLVLAAQDGTELRWHGRRVTPNTLVFQRPEAELDVIFARGALNWVLDAEELKLLLGQRAVEGALGRGHVQLSKREAEALRGLSSQVLAGFHARPQLCRSSSVCSAMREQTLVRLVWALRRAGSGVEEERRSPPPIRQMAARRVDEYIRANLSSPLPMRDLVQISGVSERALQSGFQDLFGHSPKAHVTVLRLNGVRTRLHASEPKEMTVREVANGFGFWHLGRFSAAYRRHFGDLPSKTLRGRRS